MASFHPPPEPAAILRRLWESGHAAYLVGGGVRDALLGRPESDWDVATDARPERLLEVFPAARYENRFGTVTVGDVEVTTFRRDHQYGDHRRPDAVTFTDDLVEDLARRDFTVNAIAWGRARDAGGGSDASREARSEPAWVDPTRGMEDLTNRLLRAVGDPDRRFDEDALRLVRAARLAAQLEFEIEPVTRAAMARQSHLAAWVSSERIGTELMKMLAARVPSRAFRILADTHVLASIVPDLAAQRGVPQDKIPGQDLWEHSLATLDAAAALAPSNARLKLAAILHDIGKPGTFRDGHFHGHDIEGARLAEALLARLAIPRRESQPVVRLICHHMFQYEPEWSDAAVRRFMRRVGPDLVDELLLLRRADNIGSGHAAESNALRELEHRVALELARKVPLSLRDLAVGGDDLMGELGLLPGPWIGELLDRLLESVVSDPERNTRRRLIADARSWADAIVPEAGRRPG